LNVEFRNSVILDIIHYRLIYNSATNKELAEVRFGKVG